MAILFENPFYVACLVAKGTTLTVQNKHRGMKGKALEGDIDPWLDAFATAIDDTERHDLCKAFLQS